MPSRTKEHDMATVKSRCSSCGVDLTVQADGCFEGTQVVGALCAACTDSHFLHDGGAILELRREFKGACFPLGKVRITSDAVAILAEAAEHAATFLARHVRGDWGEFGHCDQIELTPDEHRRGWEATDDDGKINKSNLLNRRDRIMSSYTTARQQTIWIITQLDRTPGTTVLVPEEY
jgi:hypothetical protein